MPATSRLNGFCLAYLSKPKADRPLYRRIMRQKAKKILEIGIGSGFRSLRMIRSAGRNHDLRNVLYAGIDLFETRPGDTAAMSLKQAYRLLKPSGARIRLIPGDPMEALARTANTLGQVDFVVISADQDQELLKPAWFYLPRLLHAGSCVFVERRDAGAAESVYRELEPSEVQRRAASRAVRRRAA